MSTASGIETAGRCVSRGDVRTDARCILLTEPRANARHQHFRDALASLVRGDVDPLQLSVATTPSRSVPCDEANHGPVVYRDVQRSFRERFLWRVFAAEIPGNPIGPESLVSPLFGAKLRHNGYVVFLCESDRYRHCPSGTDFSTWRACKTACGF